MVRQSSHDIVYVEGGYQMGDIWEQIEPGFLDYNQSYDNGELPVDWHNPPVPFADFEFND
ncbi:hypothetical protein [Thalassomonas actiniarum]|uniref:Uncharacterized protein n=1 Tax=Thalassomonas actiniarum TaxID=485447 RepID=A0AAE9YM20_9GAMM|nr:hypothetical protein [Thalassomonas actiniarum]WDD97790.1 hypothetical protein SG35_021170 [Thalassomonas actiniarum]